MRSANRRFPLVGLLHGLGICAVALLQAWQEPPLAFSLAARGTLGRRGRHVVGARLRPRPQPSMDPMQDSIPVSRYTMYPNGSLATYMYMRHMSRMGTTLRTEYPLSPLHQEL